MLRDGTVRVRRNQQPRTDRWQRYKILLDGAPMGKISAGETVDLCVPSGEHSLRLSIDWTGSPTADFTVYEGQTVEFTCQPRRRPAQSLLAVFESLFTHDRWIQLNRRA